MAFQWKITIKPNVPPSPQKFTPNPLPNVVVADEIFWSNDDTQAHWPGLKKDDGTIDTKFFMPNQIAPNSTSNGFRPSAAGNLNYVCSLPGHEKETGTIQVGS